MDSCKTFSVTSSTKIIALKIKVNGVQANAIVDTGATSTAISSRLAHSIKLEQQSSAKVTGVTSTSLAKTYFANIGLSPDIIFSNVRVVEINSIGGFDVLIGMDILTKGNFAVSVANGKSYFSYKTPPDGKIICFE